MSSSVQPKPTMLEIADTFRAIGEPNRLRILNILANRGPTCVCDLQAVLGLPQSRVSKHLVILRHTGLVQQTRRGQLILYSLTRIQNPVRASLVECMKRCFPDLPELARDLENFDLLRARGRLVSWALPKPARTARGKRDQHLSAINER